MTEAHRLAVSAKSRLYVCFFSSVSSAAPSTISATSDAPFAFAGRTIVGSIRRIHLNSFRVLSRNLLNVSAAFPGA